MDQMRILVTQSPHTPILINDNIHQLGFIRNNYTFKKVQPELRISVYKCINNNMNHPKFSMLQIQLRTRQVTRNKRVQCTLTEWSLSSLYNQGWYRTLCSSKISALNSIFSKVQKCKTAQEDRTQRDNDTTTQTLGGHNTQK